MKNYNLLLIASITIILNSCDSPVNEPEKVAAPPAISTIEIQEAKVLELPKKNKSFDFDLADNIPEREIANQLFGKFFDERAEFFVIEDPHKTVLHANVKKMTLFFLDGKLAKFKYILDTNISNQLINIYGSCKIIGLDLKNREELDNNNAIIKVNNKYLLSENLSNYQVQWDLGEKSLVMRVRTADDEILYEYEEKIKGFEKYFKTMERNKISL
ncbi:MAG: hypothetical protein M3512_14635 [Bacteroidota bacterium]|nr:hypothetical protein [Bacteroidota bacterium]